MPPISLPPSNFLVVKTIAGTITGIILSTLLSLAFQYLLDRQQRVLADQQAVDVTMPLERCPGPTAPPAGVVALPYPLDDLEFDTASSVFSDIPAFLDPPPQYHPTTSSTNRGGIGELVISCNVSGPARRGRVGAIESIRRGLP